MDAKIDHDDFPDTNTEPDDFPPEFIPPPNFIHYSPLTLYLKNIVDVMKEYDITPTSENKNKIKNMIDDFYKIHGDMINENIPLIII